MTTSMTKGRWFEASYEDVVGGSTKIPDVPGAFRIKTSRHEPSVYVGLAGTSLRAELKDETTRLAFKANKNRTAEEAEALAARYGKFKFMKGEFCQFKPYPKDFTVKDAMAYEKKDGEKEFGRGGCQRNAKTKDGKVGWLGIMHTKEANFNPVGQSKLGQELNSMLKAHSENAKENELDALIHLFKDL